MAVSGSFVSSANDLGIGMGMDPGDIATKVDIDEERKTLGIYIIKRTLA
jgi:hypothetical protein